MWTDLLVTWAPSHPPASMATLVREVVVNTAGRVTKSTGQSYG